jgi:hypothetical protein
VAKRLLASISKSQLEHQECVAKRLEGLLAVRSRARGLGMLLPLPLSLPLPLPLPLLLPPLLLPYGPYAAARQRPGAAWQRLEAARLAAPGSRRRQPR